MDLDYQWVFNIALTTAGGLAAWVVKALWDAVQALRVDMAALERSLPGSYMRREELLSMFTDVRSRLRDIQESQQRLEFKIDGKVDK